MESFIGNESKNWSRDDLRTYSFRQFAFVSEFNPLPQRYNGISKIDDIITRREHMKNAIGSYALPPEFV